MSDAVQSTPVARLSSLIGKLRVWGMAGVVSYFRRRMNDRRQARRLRRLAAASQCAAPARGVTVIGSVTGQVSLDKTLRDFIWNLREAGVPCQVLDTTPRPMIPAADVADLVTPSAAFDLRKYDHIVVMYRAPLDPALVPGCTISRIAFHDSEHGIHDTMPFLRASGDAIIAMSDFNYAYFRRAFPDQKVYKILYPLRFADKSKAMPRNELRAKYGIADDDFVVFFNFDFGSYYRKNVIAAIRAFARAFPDVPKAKLLFKTKGAKGNPRQVEEMMREIAAEGLESRFVHIASFLSKAEVDGLTGACDVYLSLHKSEGFGIGMAEAMSQGKPVVATDWSANTEFCRPDTACCVPYAMTPILPHEYPVSMKEWAEADVDAAARMLRALYDDPAQREALGQRGKTFINDYFALPNFKRDVEAWLNG